MWAERSFSGCAMRCASSPNPRMRNTTHRRWRTPAGVPTVPAFTGLGAPHWDMYARGCIIGITRGTKREHIIRAAQESIAYQSYDLVKAMEKGYWNPASDSLKVDGGASRDRF